MTTSVVFLAGNICQAELSIDNWFMKNSNKIIKIIAFSDTHLGFDYPIRPRIQRRRRGYDFFKNYEAVLEYAVSSQADLVIHCGDFFFRSKIPQLVIDKSYEILFNFAENNIPIFLIPGNHERSLLPQSILTNHPVIRVYDKPEVHTLRVKHKNIAIVGFPFIRSNPGEPTLDQKFQQILSQLPINWDDFDLRILAIHQAIEGSTVGPVNFTFRKGKDVFSKKVIPHWADLVLCGHIHRNQIMKNTLGTKSIPILFPGSIERTSFAEKEEKKGFFEIEIPEDSEIIYSFKKLYARPMLALKINPIFRDERSIIVWLKKEILKYPEDSILRIDPKHKENQIFITAELLREIIPKSMNWEVRNLRNKL